MWTILIADRDSSVVRAIRLALDPASYRIIDARDADETMLRLSSDTPDLLILDTKSGGFEILERRAGRQRDLPVIMLGANVADQDVYRGWTLGVDSFQSKNPEALRLLPTEVRAKVERILNVQAVTRQANEVDRL